MARYDWGSSRGYRGRYGPRGYASDFGRWGDEWGSSPHAGFRTPSGAFYSDRAAPYGAPVFPDRYYRSGYGGAAPSYGHSRSPGAGYRMGGYEDAYSGRTFMPEEAYRRQPALDRPQRHPSGRWPDRAGGFDGGVGMDDRFVEQSVRESLYGDTWIDPDRIQVEVDDGVVTLRGEVDDYMEARFAWDDAWESPGVRGVLNQLTVRTDGGEGE